jgi:two-component system KDP operon response regulator KdpE
MTRLLLISENATELETLTTPLTCEGYQVHTAKSVPVGLDLARRLFPDPVILDLGLLKMNWVETIQRLHELGVQSILIMGPGHDERSAVKFLKMGADDYLPKPIDIPILLAKLRALLRQRTSDSPTKPPTYDDGQLLIDLHKQQVELRGEPVKLTRTEFSLLSCLSRRVGRAVSHEDLIREVWGAEKKVGLALLKLYIHYLRQKIEDQPKKPYYLLVEWGYGYRLRPPNLEPVS